MVFKPILKWKVGFIMIISCLVTCSRYKFSISSSFWKVDTRVTTKTSSAGIPCSLKIFNWNFTNLLKKECKLSKRSNWKHCYYCCKLIWNSCQVSNSLKWSTKTCVLSICLRPFFPFNSRNCIITAFSGSLHWKILLKRGFWYLM